MLCYRAVLDHQEKNQMAWSVGKIQDTVIGQGFPAQPGFVIQQDGRSPSLTITFENRKTAEECAALMQTIIDKAAAMRGRD
jgi:hypothetical protein